MLCACPCSRTLVEAMYAPSTKNRSVIAVSHFTYVLSLPSLSHATGPPAFLSFVTLPRREISESCASTRRPCSASRKTRSRVSCVVSYVPSCLSYICVLVRFYVLVLRAVRCGAVLIVSCIAPIVQAKRNR